MTLQAQSLLARRLASNPLIRPADVTPSQPGLVVVSVFNAAAARVGEEIVLLLRVAERPRQDVEPPLDARTLEMSGPHPSLGLLPAGYRSDDPKAAGLPHGHSYRVGVTVSGPVDPGTGFVMDFRVLKAILRKEIEERFDHRFLNKEVEPFKSGKTQPTAENLAMVIWSRVAAPLKKEGVKLVSVEVWETPDSCATYRGK